VHVRCPRDPDHRRCRLADQSAGDQVGRNVRRRVAFLDAAPSHVSNGARRMHSFNLAINPLIALAVFASTAVTDAAYVFFNAAVGARRRVRAANWSAIWYLLSAFAVISYTENAAYVLFAATGSWLGAFASVTWLQRVESAGAATRHSPP